MKVGALGKKPNETKRILRIRQMYNGWLNKNQSPNTLHEIKNFRRVRKMKLTSQEKTPNENKHIRGMRRITYKLEPISANFRPKIKEIVDPQSTSQRAWYGKKPSHVTVPLKGRQRTIYYLFSTKDECLTTIFIRSIRQNICCKSVTSTVEYRNEK